jgi:hypothetical protein
MAVAISASPANSMRAFMLPPVKNLGAAAALDGVPFVFAVVPPME